LDLMLKWCFTNGWSYCLCLGNNFSANSHFEPINGKGFFSLLH